MIQEETSLIFDKIMDGAHEDKARMAFAAMLGTVPQFDLACIGSSINGLGAFTFEAVSYIACADIVYCYPTTPSHLELIRLMNMNLINMHDTLYVRGADFDSAYDAIIKNVMHTIKTGKKVAYVTQGSPAFHCGTAVALHRRAKREGFNSLLISGVSSLELLSVELSEEYDIRDIQIYSVTSLIDGRITVNPQVPCMLFDLARFALPGVRETAGALSRPKLSALTRQLCAVYPSQHEILLMYIRSTGSCARSVTKVIDLEKALIDFGISVPTIFIPAATPETR